MQAKECHNNKGNSTRGHVNHTHYSNTHTHSLSLRRNVIKGDNKSVKTLHRTTTHTMQHHHKMNPPHTEQQASITPSWTRTHAQTHTIRKTDACDARTA